MAIKVNILKTFGFAFMVIVLVSIIHAQVDPKVALETYYLAEQRLTQMQKEGYPTALLFNILYDARTSYNLNNTDRAVELSNKVMTESDRVINLQKLLLSLSNDTQVLGIYGVDTTELDFLLINAKADFEAGNIDISESEAKDVSNRMYLIERNISQEIMFELDQYMEVSIDDNTSTNYSVEFYNQLKQYYSQNSLKQLLKGYILFNDIKDIVTKETQYDHNKIELGEKNISFKRGSDMYSLFEFEMTNKEYAKAKKTIEDLYNLSSIALTLDSEIGFAKERYAELMTLGIIDNDTQGLYDSIFVEFKLENFLESKKNLDLTLERFDNIERQNLIMGGINKARLRSDIKQFLIHNWTFLLFMVILIAVLFNPIKNQFLLFRYKLKLNRLKDERQIITVLQKELQEQYFIEKLIDKKTYRLEFTNHEEKKVDLTNRIALYEQKVKIYNDLVNKIKIKLKKIGGSKNLSKVTEK